MIFTDLRFGTPGIPSRVQGTIEGLIEVSKLGLKAMELEFVHNVSITEEKAKVVSATREKEDVRLTCHAPYYINLNAVEKPKLEASKKRLINASLIADLCGAFSITFHPAFYLGMQKEKVFENVTKALKDVQKILDDNGATIRLSPETTGKTSQFGDYEELLKISKEFENMQPCIDYSHMHARNNGGWNTKEEFLKIHEMLEKSLGKQSLKSLHCHISGIEYGEKGEKKHQPLKESDMNYQELIDVWKEFNVAGVIITESSNIEEDTILLNNLWRKKR
ncbi:TIM barrel protein [Candidatus Woesearchaeota archaeon]|nr:TIM barrel protein [Candidatus Woesearchaeota archaeon]